MGEDEGTGGTISELLQKISECTSLFTLAEIVAGGKEVFEGFWGSFLD